MLGGAVRQTYLGLDLGTSAVKAVVADSRAGPADVCMAPPIVSAIEPDPRLATLLQSRRPLYSRLYASLKDLYQEFPA